MKEINLRNIPSDFRDQKDIHTALAWNAVKKILSENHREELFGYIQSIRLTEKYIIITTGKPIINAEILLFRNALLEKIHHDIRKYSPIPEKKLRVA